MPARSASRHSAPMSGWPGLPSYSTTVAPSSSPPTRKFHIIQPVVVNHRKRSAGPRSRCRASDFSSSRAMPPWPCTIGLGSPVVPDEYSTHSGWSKATASKAGSAGSAAPASSSSPATVSAAAPRPRGPPPPGQLGVGDAAELAGLVGVQQRRVVVAPPQRQLGVVEAGAGEPAGAWHGALGQRRARCRAADLEELPDRRPEAVQVVNGPAPGLVVGAELQAAALGQPAQVAGHGGPLDPLRRRPPQRLRG